MTLAKCIAADPPWWESGGGKSKRGADRHYPLMKTPAIIELMSGWLWTGVDDPEIRVDRRGAHLWLWATSNFLEDALLVMRRLGFRYVTSAVWVKIAERPSSFADSERHSIYTARDSLQIGLGQYMRHAHEWLLFGTLGKAMVPEPANRLPSVIFAPRGRHSAKPQEAYDLIERASPGPRLELFAREPRCGWTVRGNEVEL